MENLESLTDYEVYVEAVNVHGVGSPSPRLTFRTGSKVNTIFYFTLVGYQHTGVGFWFRSSSF